MSKPLGEQRRETHPSWGVVSITKANNNHDQHFGAADYSGGTSICVCISTASLEWSDELRDFAIYPEKRVIEIELTPLQFAMAITEAGGGDIPCNISFRQGQGFIKPADKITTRLEFLEEQYRKSMTDLGAGCDDLMNEARALREKSNVNKGDRERFVGLAQELVNKIIAGQPYIASKFTDLLAHMAADRRVSSIGGPFNYSPLACKWAEKYLREIDGDDFGDPEDGHDIKDLASIIQQAVDESQLQPLRKPKVFKE